jgi:hypothetical protein
MKGEEGVKDWRQEGIVSSRWKCPLCSWIVKTRDRHLKPAAERSSEGKHPWREGSIKRDSRRTKTEPQETPVFKSQLMPAEHSVTNMGFGTGLPGLESYLYHLPYL